MRWMASLLLASCATFPVNDEVPMAFRGYWVPQAQNCDAQLGLVVERDRLVLKNGTETRTFQDIDVCHSCVGGAKSDGIEIWLIPEFGTARPSPFIVRLNAEFKFFLPFLAAEYTAILPAGLTERRIEPARG